MEEKDIDKNDILKDLINKQLKNVPLSKKLQYSDLKRISKYINTGIMGDQCCLWDGYITNANSSKGTYINFFYKKKKMALHRLLYINYVGNLSSNEYLKFTCENKGSCCNVNHLEKYKYQTNEECKKINKKKDNDDDMSLSLDFD